MKKLDEYTINLILLVIFTGVLIVLERVFSESLQRFFYALLPTILLILFYILLHRRTVTFENSIKEILETHIPNIVYIENEDTLKTEFINAVNSAEKYIMTTGRRSRIKEYLSGIEESIEKKEIEYYRILFGEKISKELYDHLSKIIGKEGVYISHTPKEFAPNLLLTEKIAFIGLPEPKPHEFKTCLKIPDESIIERFGKYIRVWYASIERLTNKEDLEKIKVD